MLRKTFVISTLTILLPFYLSAQDGAGLDQRINDWFAPIADTWESIVFTTVPLGGLDVPIVLILLIGGGIFFTFYSSFVNIRKFPIALRVLRGNYHLLEKDGAEIFLHRKDLIKRNGENT